MILKTLDMSCKIDRKIILSYFFKKSDTLIDKNFLSKLSCIYYNSKQQRIYANTKRFVSELEPYQNQKVPQKEVDDTLKKVFNDSFKLQEELVRCSLDGRDEDVDYFYIAVIGVDFFQVETKFRASA